MSMAILHLFISLIIACNVMKALPVFLDRRFSSRAADIISGSLIFLVCLFPIIPDFAPTYILFCIAFSLIVMVFFKGPPFRRVAFSAMFFSVIGAWSFMTISCIGLSARFQPPLWLENSILVLLAVLCLLYFSIFSEYVKGTDKETLDSFTERLWGYAAFISLCPPIVVLLTVINPPELPAVSLLVVFFAVAASTAMIPLISQIGKSAMLAKENEKLRQLSGYYREVETEQTQIRKFKHDLMNHFTVVATYLDLGENGKAIEYFKKIGADWAKISQTYTANPLINAVLNSKYQKASLEGIDVIIKASADTSGLDDSTDLCTLISNSLDNAIEAMPPDKKISVELADDEGCILFVCSNRYAGSISRNSDGSFSTTKDDARSHGFGLKNIREAVSRMHGELKIDTSNSAFTVTARIPYPPRGGSR